MRHFSPHSYVNNFFSNLYNLTSWIIDELNKQILDLLFK